ncbi:GNAT family N-acetyltransferase [bacterium]|nr:GNAT family N-acetyltransferase [bacterium]
MRSVCRDEFESLDALLSAVFRPGLVEQYPHLYSPENTGNMRVVVQDGKVVSHIGTIRRYASLLGCTVRVASLGGVSTYPECRGKGYATALFEDWMRVCREDGVDFMLVSGYRKMYHRHGCRYVGKDFNFDVARADAGRLDDAGVEVREAGLEDAEAIAEVYRREPVRWLRPPADYRNALTSYVMNRPAQFLTLYEQGALRGYVIVQMLREQDRERKVQLLEFAGDRRSVAGALGEVVRRYDLEALRVHAAG